jgi:PAS domain S-box-containing protein
MIAVALLSYQRARTGLVDLALSKVEQEAALTAKDTETFLEQFSTDILALSEAPPVQGIVRALDAGGVDPISGESYQSGVDRLRQIFASTASSKRFYRSLLYMDETGNEIVRVEYEQGKVVIVSGDTRLGVREPWPLQAGANAAYFVNARAMDADQVYVSPVTLEHKGDEIEVPHVPIIHFSTPIYDTARRFRGVMVSTVYAASFLDRLTVEEGQVYLAGQDGFYLAHPDPNQTFGFELDTEHNVKVDFASAYGALLGSGNDAHTTLDQERSEVVALRRLQFDPRQPERYWILIRAMPQGAVLGPVEDLGGLVSGVAIAVMILVALAALWLARSFTQPIVRLKDIAGQISRRDLPQLVESLRQASTGEVVDKPILSARPVEVRSQDEVGQLGTAFNEMAFSLQEQNERIQQIAVELRETNVALKRQANQLHVASEVARDATAAGKLDELLDSAVNLIRDRFGFYHAGIFLVDRRSECAVLRAAVGETGREMLEQGYRLELNDRSTPGHVIRTGRFCITPDVGNNPEYGQDAWLPKTQSEMALPLRVGERVIGALDVQSEKEGAFDEDDVRTLQTMADQLAVALEKTRLFERAQAALEERLQTVISNAPIVLFALDREGVFTLAEGQGLMSMGIESDRVVGRPAADVWREAPEIGDEIRRALSGEAFVSLMGMDGAVFEAHWTPLRDRHGDLRGVTVVATDITERKKAEEELQRYADLLRGLSTQLAEAEEAERQRIARELHDQVGQNLTALGINLNIVKSQMLEEAGFARSRLDDSLALVVQTTERIRDVMADLRSPVLDDYGLLNALRWHGQQFSARTGIAVSVQGTEPTSSLTARTESALFRIAQEAMTNIAKHAQATQVTVTLEADDEGVSMCVADDGIGFDTVETDAGGRRRGWGLLIMSERAEAVGGRCCVESRPGQGTRVTVEIDR